MRVAPLLFVLLITYALSVRPVAAQCELGCGAECKQEAAVCNGEATLEARTGRFICEVEGGESLLECEAIALENRSVCVGSCGEELRTCIKEAKTAAKACKASVKELLAACKDEVDVTADAEKSACAEEAGACAESCSE